MDRDSHELDCDSSGVGSSKANLVSDQSEIIKSVPSKPVKPKVGQHKSVSTKHDISKSVSTKTDKAKSEVVKSNTTISDDSIISKPSTSVQVVDLERPPPSTSMLFEMYHGNCLLYTSDAADE